VLLAIEEELKECLHTLTGTPKRDEIIQRVTTNDVEFYWLIATAYFEIYETRTLTQDYRTVCEVFHTLLHGLRNTSKKQKKVHSTPRVFVGVCMTAVCSFYKHYMIV